MTTSSSKAEHARIGSTGDKFKEIREAQTFGTKTPRTGTIFVLNKKRLTRKTWKKDMQSFIQALNDWGNSKILERRKKRSSPERQKKNILEKASRIERWLNEYDSCWTQIGWPSAQSVFESSKNLNEKKEPDTASLLTCSIP